MKNVCYNKNIKLYMFIIMFEKVAQEKKAKITCKIEYGYFTRVTGILENFL